MKYEELIKISDPAEVKRRFEKYRGSTKATIQPSPRADKKYLVRVDGKRAIHFGSTLPDYTKHGDEKRRANYLARAKGIKGDWAKDQWSPNNLAIHLLW